MPCLDAAVADAKPYVSPLVDVADRGAPVGVILVGGDLVRIVQIEQAEAETQARAKAENSSRVMRTSSHSGRICAPSDS